MIVSSMSIGLILAISFSRPLIVQESTTVARIAVDATQRYQHVDGFGVNFNGLFRESQKAMVNMLIDDQRGARASDKPKHQINQSAVNTVYSSVHNQVKIGP